MKIHITIMLIQLFLNLRRNDGEIYQNPYALIFCCLTRNISFFKSLVFPKQYSIKIIHIQLLNKLFTTLEFAVVMQLKIFFIYLTNILNSI